MKILAISGYVGDPKLKQDSSIHLWRVKRPILELKKHVDWQIDFQPNIVTEFYGMENDPDGFIKKYGPKLAKDIGQYDIVYTSYFTSPHFYTILWGAAKAYGTKFIMDFDDDLFDVDPSNFAFWRGAGWQGHEFLGIIARITKFVSTTNPLLEDKLRKRSEADPKIFVIPNYIGEQYKDKTPDNGLDVVIGFFGGASHYNDVHHSGLLPALEKLMHKYKHVKFKICGQPTDHYLPKARVEDVPTVPGSEWPEKQLPSMNLDIAVAPLLDTEFNKYKSNIKWQEATRMGAAFVGSNIGPYKNLSKDVAWLVPNTEDAWFIALEELVTNVVKRKTMVAAAKGELERNWRLEDKKNWIKYKQMFEEVYSA